MISPFKRLFAPEYLVGKSERMGELPEPKTAYRTMYKIAWPSALEAVLVALVSIVDTIMVGSMGPSAISAVGVCTQPKFLCMAMILSLNTGVTAVVARRRGEGDLMGAINTMKQAIAVSSVISLIMCTLGIIFANELMMLMGAEPEYIADSIVYFRIIMSGQFLGCIGMTINAAQRGFGNTKVSMRSNLAANLVNVFFNWLLINGVWIFPRLGVRGAAIATALGATVAFLMALSSLLHRHTGGLSLLLGGSWKLDKVNMGSVVKVASSAFVEQIFLRIGFFTYAALVARLGTNEFATHQICINVIHLSFAFADGLGIASTSLVGQNLGAKRPDIAMMYGRLGQRVSMTIGVLLAILFTIFRREVIMMFSDVAEIIDMGAVIMLIVAATALAQTSQVVISGCLRGAGDSKFVALSSFISVGIIRPGLSYILCYPLGWGLVGAWLGLFFDQFLRLILNFGRFKSAKWTNIKL